MCIDDVLVISMPKIEKTKTWKRATTLIQLPIGKAKIIMINSGAYSLPSRIKNKNTKAAVGALFKTIIKGFIKTWTFWNDPASTPRINAPTKAIEKPNNVLRRDHPMHL